MDQVAVLSRGSTAEELAAVLRDMIMSGELAPDAPMREAALSEQFSVSRRTVRDALGVLEHEGLVRHHRHKGSRVVRFDVADIHDLYAVRRTLETAAGEHCAAASPVRRVQLGAAFDRLADATTLGRTGDVVQCDLEFHRAVVGLLDSRRIDDFFAAIAVEMRFALAILEASYHESRHRPKAALDEHRAIRDALLAGDALLASRLIAEHVEVNEALLVRAIEAG